MKTKRADKTKPLIRVWNLAAGFTSQRPQPEHPQDPGPARPMTAAELIAMARTARKLIDKDAD